jgi:hypothetical protein
MFRPTKFFRLHEAGGLSQSVYRYHLVDGAARKDGSEEGRLQTAAK